MLETREYTVIRTLAGVFVVAAVLTAIGAVWFVFTVAPNDNWMALVLLIGFLQTIAVAAVGQLLHLAVDVAQNVERIALLLPRSLTEPRADSGAIDRA